MFNLVHLQAERSHKALLAQDLVEKAEKAEGGPRPMTTEECKLFDDTTEQIRSLDAQIAAVVAHQERAVQSAALIEQMNSPAGR